MVFRLCILSGSGINCFWDSGRKMSVLGQLDFAHSYIKYDTTKIQNLDLLKYLDTILLGWIYPVAQYWSWSVSLHSGAQGWLKSLGFSDFAGSGVVHLLGGTCGLVGCIMTGPRSNTSGEQGHSKPLVALGGAILLLGFLAFNSGSAVSKNNINSGI